MADLNEVDPGQLAASLSTLRESELDIAAGRTQDMREALQEIA